jgi:MFS transporter, ACS family, solute carrier family 17 (sodium-dependent inorganic phosphate cotransporter), member 5
LISILNYKKKDGTFLWTKQVQGFVLSAYFYGYALTQIAGGYLATKFGAKRVLASSIFIASIFTLLTPLASEINYILAFTARFVIGVFHGLYWPAMSTMWSFWAPPTERSRLVGFANGGTQIGNVVSLTTSAFLCTQPIANGWPLIFYLGGGIGIVWTIVWMLTTSDSPTNHKFITEDEKSYVLGAITTVSSKGPTPWFKIIKSGPVWAVIIANTCTNMGLYTFLTQLPTYMKEILKFDIKSVRFLFKKMNKDFFFLNFLNLNLEWSFIIIAIFTLLLFYIGVE